MTTISHTTKTPILTNDAGGFGLQVELDVFAPGMEPDLAERVVARAHEVCPYSDATRGNARGHAPGRLSSRHGRGRICAHDGRARDAPGRPRHHRRFGVLPFLEVADEVVVDTPYGPTSAPVTIADVSGTVSPSCLATASATPSRRTASTTAANISRLSPSSVSERSSRRSPPARLRREMAPGDLVVVDQFVDRTSGRADTFHDDFADGPQHAVVADPYDPRLRSILADVGRSHGFQVHDGGTVVVVNGPGFSTRAESAWFRDRAGTS